MAGLLMLASQPDETKPSVRFEQFCESVPGGGMLVKPLHGQSVSVRYILFVPRGEARFLISQV